MTELDKIRKYMKGRTYEEIFPVTRENAVLIPLVEKEGELHILFEVRLATIRQGGEICFPGGRIEKNETPEEAAVRETSEELLLSPQNIEVIAPLHVMSGPGGAKICSCLGVLHGYTGTYSNDEVDHIFTVPLRWFAENTPRISDGAMTVKTAEDFPYEFLPGGRDYPWNTIPRRFYFYETRGGVIWGLTAELLHHALGVLWKNVSKHVHRAGGKDGHAGSGTDERPNRVIGADERPDSGSGADERPNRIIGADERPDSGSSADARPNRSAAETAGRAGLAASVEEEQP